MAGGPWAGLDDFKKACGDGLKHNVKQNRDLV